MGGHTWGRIWEPQRGGLGWETPTGGEFWLRPWAKGVRGVGERTPKKRDIRGRKNGGGGPTKEGGSLEGRLGGAPKKRRRTGEKDKYKLGDVPHTNSEFSPPRGGGRAPGATKKRGEAYTREETTPQGLGGVGGPQQRRDLLSEREEISPLVGCGFVERKDTKLYKLKKKGGEGFAARENKHC